MPELVSATLTVDVIAAIGLSVPEDASVILAATPAAELSAPVLSSMSAGAAMRDKEPESAPAEVSAVEAKKLPPVTNEETASTPVCESEAPADDWVAWDAVSPDTPFSVIEVTALRDKLSRSLPAETSKMLEAELLVSVNCSTPARASVITTLAANAVPSASAPVLTSLDCTELELVPERLSVATPDSLTATEAPREAGCTVLAVPASIRPASKFESMGRIAGENEFPGAPSTREVLRKETPLSMPPSEPDFTATTYSLTDLTMPL